MTERASGTASAQLERILYLLPAAAREGGMRIDDLAAALGVEREVVMRDLQDVTARTFYHPAGAVDSFNILMDDQRVEVYAPSEFQRPVRLNSREALALGLGLRVLASEAAPARRSDILDLAARLEAELGAPKVQTVQELRASSGRDPHRDTPDAPEVELEEYVIALDDDGFRGVVADAIELGRLCTIWYLKPGDVAPAYRTVAPYRLVHANGHWYVAAYDTDREGVRIFRMDRVLDARLEEESVPALPQDELEAVLSGPAPYAASDDIEVSVRYSPRVARWIAERTSDYETENGSVIVRHRVADRRWIVRHVLQYGGEAVVEAPPEARAWVVAALPDPEPDI